MDGGNDVYRVDSQSCSVTEEEYNRIYKTFEKYGIKEWYEE